MSEHDEQVLFFQYIRLNKQLTRNPKLRTALNLCYAVPNGGKRYIKTAIDLQKSGQEAGIPDINLDVPVKNSLGEWQPGLRIEMKFGKNKLSKHQQEKKLYYEGYGFHYVICYSGKAAIEALINYLPFKRQEYITL